MGDAYAAVVLRAMRDEKLFANAVDDDLTTVALFRVNAKAAAPQATMVAPTITGNFIR